MSSSNRNNTSNSTRRSFRNDSRAPIFGGGNAAALDELASAAARRAGSAVESDSEDSMDAFLRSPPRRQSLSLRDRQNAMMAVGQDEYDPNVPLVDNTGFMDPITRNWLVSPVRYGNADQLLNAANVKFLREVARERGQNFVIHPTSNQQIPVSQEPVPDPTAAEMVPVLYEQQQRLLLAQQRAQRAPTQNEIGRAPQEQEPNRHPTRGRANTSLPKIGIFQGDNIRNQAVFLAILQEAKAETQGGNHTPWDSFLARRGKWFEENTPGWFNTENRGVLSHEA